MTKDLLPPDYAPFHMIRTENGKTQGVGLFHDLALGVASCRFMRQIAPGVGWAMMDERGVIDDSKIVPRAFQWPNSTI